ncbi:MAG: polysaccharide deacetylase family protein [Candidatus Zixiibacteriota bacterium]|nr:MAG: polysaccharide deacetylase family protein [candidate division Zixibacteria bacterium]
MKRFLINLILAAADILGVNILYNFLNRRRIRVLMYHAVSSETLPTFYWTRLDRDKFAWQMEHLKNRFNVLKASGLLKDESDVCLSKRAVMISFDDGYENVFTIARPILERLNLPAICFVLPELSEAGRSIWPDELYDLIFLSNVDEIDLSAFDMGKRRLGDSIDNRLELYHSLVKSMKSWPHRKRQKLLGHLFATYSDAGRKGGHVRFKLMTPEQVAEISGSDLFEIGLHTNTHPILSTMPVDEQEREIKSAADYLSHRGIGFLPIFAYPNGRPEDFTEETIAILERHGIKAAFTSIDGLHDLRDEQFHVRRINIGADINRWEFKARLSGFFYFLQGLKGN